MNKFLLRAISTLVLLSLICDANSQAFAATRKKKHKTTQSTVAPSKTSKRNRHSAAAQSSVHTRHIVRHVAPKPRYAYPMGLFLMEPPTFEATPLPDEISTQIKKAFYSGNAGDYPTRSLVRAGIASYYPMRGGVFWRREPIKYLIMHSTEPGASVGAKTIVDGWSHGGRRHAGAHYVIDRDGTIYQSVDPDLATVHVNIFKTLPGINNDNSVGVEMCHTGSQDYPPALFESACRLAAYLQSHYHIADAHIITHRYAQQGDHTDPVNFGWDDFIAQKNVLQNLAINQKLALLKTQILNWQPIIEQPAIIVVDKKNQTIKQITTTTKTVTPKIIEVRTVKPETIKTEITTEIKTETKTEFKVENKSEPKIQSAFEAKFGSVDKPTGEVVFETRIDSASKTETNEQTQTTRSAPLPSYQAYTGAPISKPLSNTNNIQTKKDVVDNLNANRLMPTPPITRLIPVTMVINTQPNNNTANTQAHKYLPGRENQSLSSTAPNIIEPSKRSTRGLPLRGPIEMEPDEAMLLSQ